MRRRRARTAFRIARVVAAIAVITAVSIPQAGAAGSITGGGSSFAALEFNQWLADVARPPYNIKVDYTAQGSGFGRTAFLTGQLFYGASDIELQAEDQQTFNSSSRQQFVYVPTTAGGLAMAYHLTGTDGSRIRNLKANQRNVCRLLTEEGMYWDDPELAAENPGVPLPHTSVARGQRAESAGETFLFSQFCIATAPDVWGRFVQLSAASPDSQAPPELLAGKPMSRWPSNTPSNTGAYNGADNLANGIASGEGSIAFMAYGYAKLRTIPVISVKNTAGVYLQPNPQNVSIALTYAIRQENGTFKLNYVANNPDAYFPSTYSYVLAPTANTDPGDGGKLATFLNYSVTYGQLAAERLGYCRLSREVIELSIDKIAQIPGAPPKPTDLANPPGAPRTSGNTPGLAAGGSAASNQAAAAMLKAAAAKKAAAAGAASPADVAAAEAAAAAAATTDTAAAATDELALGAEQLDMSKVAKSSAPVRTAAISDNVSNADTVWYFLLGFLLIAAGLGIGSVSSFRSRGEPS